MKICPMCGSDVLGGGDVKTCTSCGADMEETTKSRQNVSDDGNAPPASTLSPGFNDVPIAKSDDLEVVSSGQAFWAETKRDDEDTDRVPSGESAEAAAEEDDTQKLAKSSAGIATAPADRKDAPSLSDLARQRKERLQHQEDSDETEATGKVEVPKGDSVPTLAGLTGNQPAPKEKSAPKTKPATAPELAVDDEPDKAIKVVTQAPQIAYFEESTVSVPGAHFQNGETILVSGRPYELKRRLAKSWLNRDRMMVGGGGLAIGLLVALIISAMGGGGGSQMYGAVRDAETGMLLPGVTISIDELNRTVETDPLGMFHISGVEGGIYTLSGSDPIYGVVQTQVSVAGDMTSVLLELGKPEARAEAPLPPESKAPVKSAPPKEAPPKTKPSKRASSPGQVVVAASVSNAEVYLDGRLLGVGNGVYEKIKPGSHKVTVKRDGYKNWERQITVAGGEASRLEPTLVPNDDVLEVRLTHGEFFDQGRRAIEAGDYARAVTALDAAIEIERLPQYFAWRAEANLGLGYVVRAERDYLDAIDGFDHAQEYSRLDQLFDRAVQAVGSSAEIWFARGEYMYRRSKPKSSSKAYRRAMDLGADAKSCWIGVGLAEYAQGNFQMASDAWSEADELAGRLDLHVAGYLALANAWLQYRTSCRNAVRRVEADPEILQEFRRHPDWDKVQRLTGGG